MPNYLYQCEDGHTQELFKSMNDEKPNSILCSQCFKPMYRVYGNFNWCIKGWSPGNELKQDEQAREIERALTDTTPVTQTEVDVATEQLVKRAERRGEEPGAVLSEVMGTNKKISDKPLDAGTKAKIQRALIDSGQT